MNTAGRLIAATAAACIGVWLVVSGWRQRRPPLSKMVEFLSRAAPAASAGTSGLRDGVGRWLLRGRVVPPAIRSDLVLVGRSPEVHASRLVTAATAGLIAPALVVAVGQAAGFVARGVVVPVVAALGGAVLLPLAVHLDMRQRAADLRVDLRHQLSAYLDVVTMLLAGNVGNEGSLRQAARAGDGRLFVELRRHMLSAETANRSLVSALATLGAELDLVELTQIAASASLGATSGAPVARTLGAKCASLRNTLSAEQEAQARVRTGRITIPLVGMSLLIMAAVIYPALHVT